MLVGWLVGDAVPTARPGHGGSMPAGGRSPPFFCVSPDHGMLQIVENPTRGDNTLELIVVNNPTLVNRTEVLPGISDHDAVFAEIDISPKRYKQAKRRIPLYKKGDWEKTEDEMRCTNQYIQNNINIESTDSLWNRFKNDLLQAIRKYIPHKTCSTQIDHHG